MIGSLTIHTITEQESNMDKIITYFKYIFSLDSWRAWVLTLLFIIFVVFFPIYFLDNTSILIELITNGDTEKMEIFKKLFIESQQKFDEFKPFIVISLASISLIFANTLFYFFEYIYEIATKTTPFKYSLPVLLSFFLWLFVSGKYLIFNILLNSDNINDKFTSLIDRNNITSKDKYNEVIDSTFRNYLTEHFEGFVANVEYYVFWVIFSFVLIELTTYLLRKKTNAHKKEIRFILNQFWLIDIPVVIGSFLIFKFVHYLKLEGTHIIDTDAPDVFTLGALAMHLIFSQVVFLILSIRDSYTDYLEKKGLLDTSNE